MDNIVLSQYEEAGGHELSRRGFDDEEILQILDQQIDQAIASHNIDLVVMEIAKLRRATRVMGISLVRLLGRIEENWESFGINEDPADYLYAETGLNRATVDRYIKVYKMLQMAPEEVRPKLQAMNVKALIPVGNALAQGHELDDDEWEKVANAEKYDEVAEIMREVKGSKPRKSGLRLWASRNGDIYAYVNTDDGQEARRYICTLPLDSNDPIITKAIERIIRNSGVMAEWEV